MYVILRLVAITRSRENEDKKIRFFGGGQGTNRFFFVVILLHNVVVKLCYEIRLHLPVWTKEMKIRGEQRFGRSEATQRTKFKFLPGNDNCVFKFIYHNKLLTTSQVFLAFLLV